MENTDKICKILLLPASYGPRESGSSLRVSFFVADRKQLQIARGIAAHGTRQTEVSENKPRAAPLRARNKAEEITNATPARLLPRETGTRIKIRELVSATVDTIVAMIKMLPREKATRAFQIANRVICHGTYLQNVRWTRMGIDDQSIIISDRGEKEREGGRVNESEIIITNFPRHFSRFSNSPRNVRQV